MIDQEGWGIRPARHEGKRGDMATKRIGILTGGGDVPGLNGVIKGVTYRADEFGYEVIGIRRGWEGLTHRKPGKALDENVHRATRPGQHAHHRSNRGHVAAQLAHQPAQDEEGRPCRPP